MADLRALLVVAGCLLCGCGARAPGERQAAITNGALDSGDPAVVALLSHGTYVCSGTVVSPRVVVTAAHCLDRSIAPDTVYFGAAPGDGGPTSGVLFMRAHPAFDPMMLTNDVGLIVLSSDASAAPIPLWAAPFNDSFIGTPIRLIGFGLTSGNDTSPAKKNQGTSRISAFTAGDFTFHATPSQTCIGDSGGPALLTSNNVEYLAGTTSYGDIACTDYGRDMRVDANLDFISSFLTQAEAGVAALGARCFYPENCSSGQCYAPTDAPDFRYCTKACGQDGDCAPDLKCVAGACRHPSPSPGALGAACGQNSDCEEGACAQEIAGGRLTCGAACDATHPSSCASGFVCRPDVAHPSSAACFRAPAGCSFLPRPPAGGELGLLAIVLAVQLALRSKRSKACPSARSAK